VRQLHNHIAGLVGDGSLARLAEVKLDAISGLKYEHVIEAISAVSGTAAPDGQVHQARRKDQVCSARGRIG